MVFMRQKMFHRAEQIGTEPAAALLDGVEAMSCEEAREKLLRELAGRIIVMAPVPDKGEHRRVIGAA